MIRFLVFMATMGFVSVTEAASAGDMKSLDIVIDIHRSAGFTNPERDKPIDHYEFTVVKDGRWELKPRKGESRKGELSAEELSTWLEAIDRGLDDVESDPMLGAADESFMDVTVQTRDGKDRVRIRLTERLSQAIEKNIVELARR